MWHLAILSAIFGPLDVHADADALYSSPGFNSRGLGLEGSKHANSNADCPRPISCIIV